jgi:flavin-dependent dehydrogenase
MADTPEIVIIGGGIGGGAAATVLARQGLSVAVLSGTSAPSTECTASLWRHGVLPRPIVSASLIPSTKLPADFTCRL